MSEQKTWIVTRIVRERFEVQHAENANEAKDLAADPFSVEVVKESARRWKPKPPTVRTASGETGE